MARKDDLSKAASQLGKRGFRAKLKKYGREYIAEHARKVGKLGGRPRKKARPRKGSKA